MASSTSNKRQRMNSTAQHQHNSPYEYLDMPHYKDLPNQRLIPYEDIKTEADITNVVEKLDIVDVKKVLAQTIRDLSESNARKLLVNAALSTEIIHIRTWGELTHIQLLTKNERALRIQKQRSPRVDSAMLVQQPQPPQQPQQPQQPEQPQQVDLPRQSAPPIIYETWAYGFDPYVEQVDYIINEKWAKLSGSKQYNKAWDATELVNKEISKIAQMVTIRSSCDTKINALLGLCAIAGYVAVGGDCIGSEVRKHVGYDDVLVNTMLDIVNLMTVSEKRTVTRDDMDAFEALDKERKGYCVFDGLEQVLEKLKEGVVDLPTTTHDLDDDDDYGDIDEQAMLNTSDAIEGSASQPIEL